MSDENLKHDSEYGKLLLKWNFPEYESPVRNKSWYFVSSLAFIIILVYSLVTSNFIFAIFLILFALIIFLHLKGSPLEVEFKIYEDGLVLGNRFYEWAELKSFRLVYKPPYVKRLYFDTKNNLTPEVSVNLEKENPLEVRKILKNYLKEDLEKEEEILFDKINRWLKI